jgi:hypothetical protein
LLSLRFIRQLYFLFVEICEQVSFETNQFIQWQSHSDANKIPKRTVEVLNERALARLRRGRDDESTKA